MNKNASLRRHYPILKTDVVQPWIYPTKKTTCWKGISVPEANEIRLDAEIGHLQCKAEKQAIDLQKETHQNVFIIYVLTIRQEAIGIGNRKLQSQRDSVGGIDPPFNKAG